MVVVSRHRVRPWSAESKGVMTALPAEPGDSRPSSTASAARLTSSASMRSSSSFRQRVRVTEEGSGAMTRLGKEMFQMQRARRL
ncbi:unnamed protein product [Chrysoparadoxa australica]